MIDSLSFEEFHKSKFFQHKLQKRYKAEKRFKRIGFYSILFSFVFLILLLTVITKNAIPAFFTTKIQIPIFFDSKYITKSTNDNGEIFIEKAKYKKILKNSLKNRFSGATTRKDKASLYFFTAKSAKNDIENFLIANPNRIGEVHYVWLKASSKIDQYFKGNIKYIANNSQISALEYKWIEELKTTNSIESFFNFSLFTNGDSTNPEEAGIFTAFIGSIFTMFIFMLIAFPLGVLTAIYLEEFSTKNKFTDIIEININNLAAIPSVIFGLLGLAIFINFLHFPRSSALVGGFTLSLLVLPTIVIAARNSIKAVPRTIKDAALALGASPLQVALNYTLPLSLPGILTGTIIAISRALGETAPLLMIGMVAFIMDPPSNINEPTTVLPVQIYLWSDKPEIGFIEKTSASILILIVFLFLINLTAIILRQKYTKRW